jgi:hypothetical protein
MLKKSKRIIKLKGIDYRIFGLLFLGLILRIYRLTYYDLWFDETITFFKVFYKPAEISNVYLWDKHPFLYFSILKQWSNLFGNNDFSLRFFSVIFGVLSIWLVYKLARLFWDKSTALLAAIFTCLSPFHLWYSQEARLFTFSLFLNLSSAYFFIKIIKRKKYINWLYYLLSSLAAIFTSYFSFLLILAQVVIMFFYSKRWVYKISIFAFSFLVFILLGIFSDFYSQVCLIFDNFWIPPPGLTNFFNTFQVFLLGYNGFKLFYFLVFLLSSLLIIRSMFIFNDKNKHIYFIFFMVPFLITYLASKFIVPIYLHRNLLIFSPFFYLFLAQSITSFNKKIVRFGVSAFFIIVLVVSVFSYYFGIVSSQHMWPGTYSRRDTRQVVKKFINGKKEGDVPGFSHLGLESIWIYYYCKIAGGRDFSFLIPRFYFYRLGGKDSYMEKIIQRGSLSEHEEKDIKFNIDTDSFKGHNLKRLWLFSTSWKREGGLSPNDKTVREWFNKHYEKEEMYYLDGIYIDIYDITKPF